MIRNKVLRAALEAEQRTRNSKDAERGALTRINYDFGPSAVTEEGLVRIDIRPRRNDTLLIDGSILLTEEQSDLVRIEGRLVKRPSFWTRRVTWYASTRGWVACAYQCPWNRPPTC